MRLNELPLVCDLDCLICPEDRILSVVFLDPGSGHWTWRGSGQSTPKCHIVGVADVVVQADGTALAVHIHPGGDQFSMGIIENRWGDVKLFGPHNMVVEEQGYVGWAIWFEREVVADIVATPTAAASPAN
jgi:hypothetical protein